MNTEKFIFSTDLPWQQNSYVTVRLSGKSAVRICTNKEGLLSLASHLELLANSKQSSIIYEDTPGDLEDSSLCLEIQKVDCAGKANYAYSYELLQKHGFEMAHIPNLTFKNPTHTETENQHLYTAAPEKRYKYLLHSLQKNHCLWILGNGSEGLTIETQDEKALLVWPEAVYARSYAQHTQPVLKPICLTWDNLYSLAQSSLSDPKAGFFVFATRQNGYLVSADKFLTDLETIK